MAVSAGQAVAFAFRPHAESKRGGFGMHGQKNRARGPIILIIIMMTFRRGIPKQPHTPGIPLDVHVCNARDQDSVLSAENTQDSS